MPYGPTDAAGAPEPGEPLTPKPDQGPQTSAMPGDFGYQPQRPPARPGGTVPPNVVYPPTAFAPGTYPPGADPVDPYGQGAEASGPYAQFTLEPTADQVPFGRAVHAAFQQVATFEGRATRAEFWWFLVFVWATSAAPLALLIFGNTVLAVIGVATAVALSVVNMVALVSGSVRRLHDGGYSGWLSLLWLLAGFVVLIFAGLPTKTLGNQYQPPSKVAFEQPRSNPRWPYALAPIGALLTIIGMFGVARWDSGQETVPAVAVVRASEALGVCWDTSAAGGPAEVPCTSRRAVGRIIGFADLETGCDPAFPEKSYTRPGSWVCLEDVNVDTPASVPPPAKTQAPVSTPTASESAQTRVVPAGRASEEIGVCWNTAADGGPAEVPCDSPEAVGIVIGYSKTETGCDPAFPEKSYARPGEWVCLSGVNDN